MGSELVCVFFVDSAKYYLWAYYDCMNDYDNHKVGYYDLFDENGSCLNEGDPYYEFPSYKDIYDFVTEVINVR